jgi:hypothetical protein
MGPDRQDNAGKGARIPAAPAVNSGGLPGCGQTRIKSIFVKPQLICHGRVVDLTNQFGGSLTPEEREAQGFE